MRTRPSDLDPALGFVNAITLALAAWVVALALIGAAMMLT